MRKLMVFVLLWIGIIFLAPASIRAERFEFSSEVNRWIPNLDSTGIRDTMLIPFHINIQDINFFMGIGQDNQPWAEDVLIDVFSPTRQAVRLNDWGGVRFWWYYFWYDTDRQEDGPGELEDYAVSDAFGDWELFCFDAFNEDSLFWYYWRIEIYGELITGIQGNENKGLIPEDFLLRESYPNPFNSSTMIEYGLPEESRVKIEIYDILGRLCRTLINSEMPAGYHQIQWNGEDESDQPVASGVYLVKMTAGDRHFTNRAVLVK
jgi:hypothetical protein